MILLWGSFLDHTSGPSKKVRVMLDGKINQELFCISQLSYLSWWLAHYMVVHWRTTTPTMPGKCAPWVQSPLWTAAKRKNENQVAHSNPECFHHWCTWLAEFTLKLPQFQSAHATTKSISIIDRLFWLSKLKKPASRVLQSTTKLWKRSYERRSCTKQEVTLKHWRKQVHVFESTV